MDEEKTSGGIWIGWATVTLDEKGRSVLGISGNYLQCSGLVTVMSGLVKVTVPERLAITDSTAITYSTPAIKPASETIYLGLAHVISITPCDEEEARARLAAQSSLADMGLGINALPRSESLFDYFGGPGRPSAYTRIKLPPDSQTE